MVLNVDEYDIYLRYMDDIFVVIEKDEQLQSILVALGNNSVLKFKHELGNNKLLFLDVRVESSNQ